MVDDAIMTQRIDFPLPHIKYHVTEHLSENLVPLNPSGCKAQQPMLPLLKCALLILFQDMWKEPHLFLAILVSHILVQKCKTALKCSVFDIYYA